MQSIAWGVLDVALSNAAVAAAAAVLVWIASRIWRKPALSHALWLIVLLKLMTPPIWTVPVHVRHAQAQPVSNNADMTVKVTGTAREVCAVPTEQVRDATVEIETANDFASEPAGNDSITILSAPESAATPSAPPAAVPEIAGEEPLAWTSNWRQWIVPVIVLGWAMVSVLWLLVSGLRIARFHRTLRFAILAPPELQREADRLARAMGMKASASVWLIPGAVCPMLWAGIGKARVLVPRELWGRLDRRQRHTLLVHELAHLRRRDHWVRYVELIVTALYWWNPICWWARHELREAEEQCCDAWVMDMMPGAFREYAHALLEAVDFVSAESGAPRRDAVPMLASGMGQFGHLKRRLTMLKQGHVARALNWGGWSAAIGVGALLLPLTPTFGQEKENPKPAETAQKSSDSRENVTVATSSAPTAQKASGNVVQVTTSDEPAPPEAAPPAPPTPAAPGSVSVAPAPSPAPILATTPPDVVPVAPAALPPAPEADDDDEKGADNEARNRDRDFRRQMQDVQRQKAGQQRAQAELARAERDVQMLSQRLQEASARLQKLQSQLAQQQGMIGAGNQFNFNEAPNPISQPKEFKAYIDAQTARGMAEMKAATKDGKVFTFRSDAGPKPPPSAGVLIRPRGGDDERMDRLEKQLSELMKEVRDLRRERQRNDGNNKQGSQRDSNGNQEYQPLPK